MRRNIGEIPTACEHNTILAIDPGQQKCGVAVLERAGQIRYRGISTTESLISLLQQLITLNRPIAIVLGNGTGAKPLLLRLQQQFSIPIHSVDEAYTSEQARVRWLAENEPRGWERFLPRSLRTPTTPYDDCVAILLAERYWQSQSGTEPNSDSGRPTLGND